MVAVQRAVRNHNQGVWCINNAPNSIKDKGVKQAFIDTVHAMRRIHGPTALLVTSSVIEHMRLTVGEESEGRTHCDICHVWVKNIKSHHKTGIHQRLTKVDELKGAGYISLYPHWGLNFPVDDVAGLLPDKVAVDGPSERSNSRNVYRRDVWSTVDRDIWFAVGRIFNDKKVRRSAAGGFNTSNRVPDSDLPLVAEMILDTYNGGDLLAIRTLGLDSI
jgi:hypothetical protein